MIRYIQYSILFIILVLLQIFAFNNLHIGTYVIINIYPMFTLLLPLECPGWKVIIASALMGMTLDIMSFQPGINTIALTAMAYCRTLLFPVVLGKNDEFERGIPTVAKLGNSKFIFISSLLILVHSFTLYTVESLSFFNLYNLLLRIVLSSIATVIAIYISNMLLFRNSSTNGSRL